MGVMNTYTYALPPPSRNCPHADVCEWVSFRFRMAQIHVRKQRTNRRRHLIVGQQRQTMSLALTLIFVKTYISLGYSFWDRWPCS